MAGIRDRGPWTAPVFPPVITRTVGLYGGFCGSGGILKIDDRVERRGFVREQLFIATEISGAFLVRR
jgi:hypothetical protein